MLGPDQGYDAMYAQGPPSVHSNHGGRPYQQQGMYLLVYKFIVYFKLGINNKYWYELNIL